MPSFEAILEDKNARLESIPLELQTVLQKQQKQVIRDILNQLDSLETVNGQIKISAANIRVVANISDELKSILLSEDYLKAVKQFASEFEVQANVNDALIKKSFGNVDNPVASEIYIQTAKRSAVDAFVGSGIDANFVKPIQGLLEQAVVNGSSRADIFDSITEFIEGSEGNNSKLMRYQKQIANDSFAIADRSYTSIVSDALGNDWYYYSGGSVDKTRCFCQNRVGNYYHYLEVESWGNGENLGECDLGDGNWAGETLGTDSSTIYSYLGGYNCMHSLIPVSEAVVPESDIERARELGYID